MPQITDDEISATLAEIPRVVGAARDEDRLRVGTFAELAKPGGIEITGIRDNAVVVVVGVAPERRFRFEPSAPSKPPAGPPPAKGGLQGPIKWEGGEHVYIGDHAKLHFPDGDKPGTTQLGLHNGLALSYGQIVALSGDFYGLVGEPISLDPKPPDRFLRAFGTLSNDPYAATEAPQILKILQIEIDAVNKAVREGREPSTAYAALGDELSERWNVLTGGGLRNPITGDPIGPPSKLWLWPLGRYLQLADDNYDHFGELAMAAYSMGHRAALDQALIAYKTQNPSDKTRQLILAYAMNAFADHFLTDLFSAGHLRTPRRELSLVSVTHAAGSLMAKLMHDEDNCWGLWVHNSLNHTWKAFGDKKLLDKANAVNLTEVQAAIQASIDDIYTAFSSGKVTMPFAALSHIPNLSAVSDYNLRDNPAALFIKTQQGNEITVERRNDLGDRFSYAWIQDWTVAGTYAKIPSQDTCGSSEIPFELDINTLRLRNLGGPLGINIFGPRKGGGYGVIWNSGDLHAGYGALAWLRINDNLTTRIVQAWDNNGQLGLTTYGPDGNNGYKVAWSNIALFPRSDSIGWLTGDVGVNHTNIVRLWNNNGLLGITTFQPDGNGGYTYAWNADVIDPHAGAGAAAWFKCKNGDGTSSILQVWNNNGLVGMITYVPNGEQGYQVGWANANMGVPINALSWQTIEVDGLTYILQMSDTSNDSGQIVTVSVYAPDGKGGYTVRRQGYYDNVSGIWTTGVIAGQPCLVHLYNNKGNLASTYTFWPITIGAPYVGVENMGIDPGNDPGALGWVTLLKGDGDTLLARFRNVNGNLGIALFGPQPWLSNSGVYQLAGRNDNLGVPADSIAFFGIEQVLA